MAKTGQAVTQQGATGIPTEARRQRQLLLKKVALLLPFALLLVYFATWAREVEANRGLEGIVRRADFVSTLTGALTRIAAPGRDGSAVELFEGVVILKEARPKDGILDSMGHVLAKIEAADFGSQPLATLRGTLYQARGDVAGAVGAYRSAGTYFPTGDEYLRTAEGYAARGEDTKAWREAVLSKFWQPDKPGVHKWLAAELLATGYRSESAVEAQIAERLAR